MAETSVDEKWKDSSPPPDWKDSAPPPDSDGAAAAPATEETGPWTKYGGAQAWDESGKPIDTAVLPPVFSATMSAPPRMFSGPWFKQKLVDAESALVNDLPMMGATAGGTVGGIAGSSAGPAGGALGAIGGAGLGGMAGRAGSQLLGRMFGFPEMMKKTGDEAAKDITKEGIIQGGIQAGTELLPVMGGPAMRAATRQYERALAPTTVKNKVIASKITPELMRRGEFGSLRSLEERAGTQAKAMKPPLDTAYNATSPTMTSGSGTQIVKDLEQLKGKYTVQGQTANPTAVKAIEGVQDIVRQYGPDIDPKSLRKLKDIFDEPVAARGGYAGGDLTTSYTLKAQKAAADSIRGVMEKANPDVAALNKEISFWLNVQRVTRASGLRRTGQEGGLVKALAPLATALGGGVGMAVHGPAGSIEGAGIAMLGAVAAKVARSPQWRTASAVAKARFAEALASGSVSDATALAARFGVAAASDQSKTESRPSANRQAQ